MKARYPVLLAAAAIASGCGRDEPREPSVTTPPASRLAGARLPADLRKPRFSLRDQRGTRVTQAALNGHPTALLFLAARCGALCVLTVSQVKGAIDDIRPQPGVVAVSIDPEHDSAGDARRLLARTGMTGRMSFLLGSRRDLAPVWRGFGVQPRLQRRAGSARILLLDRAGEPRVAFPLPQATPERIAHDLRILGAE